MAGFLGQCPGSEVVVSVLPGQGFLRFKAGGQIQPLFLHSFKPHVVSSGGACLCGEEIFAEGCGARGSDWLAEGRALLLAVAGDGGQCWCAARVWPEELPPLLALHSRVTLWSPTARSTLAIDWDPETRSLYYDEQESEVGPSGPGRQCRVCSGWAWGSLSAPQQLLLRAE